MKKLILYALSAVLFFALFSCKKNNDTTIPTPASSQWTLRGTSYTGLSTLYDTSVFSILTSADAAGHYASVTFYTRPAASGVYTAIDGTTPTPTSCLVNVYDGTDIYSSTGATGNSVTLTISGTHVTAAFSNITVKSSGTATYALSGSLYR